MSTKDVVADARARIKKIAASMLARKEALVAERARLEAAGLEERIREKDEEIAVAERDLKDALEQLDELGRLGKDAERAELRAIIDAPAAEDVALENVRAHIENLEARAELEDELSGRPPREASRPEPRSIDPRQELEALKAKRKKGGGGDDADPPEESGNRGPKRTL